MTPSTLAILILCQIIVFQFMSIWLTQSVFAVRLGVLSGPKAVSIAAYLYRAARIRIGVGTVLGLATLASFLPRLAEPGTRKLVLAVVSLCSTAAFALAIARDMRAARAAADALPSSGRRRASLQPRPATKGYHPVWEAVPVLIFLATVALMLRLRPQIGGIPTAMWPLLAAQLVVVVAGLVLTRRHVIGVPNAVPSPPALDAPDEPGLELGGRLAAAERRSFMTAKIGVALLLGLGAARVGYSPLDHEIAELLGTLRWGVVGALFLTFATYVISVAALTRHIRRRNRSHPTEGGDTG